MNELPTSQADGHTFNTAFATLYGVHEAILINHFQHWINHNKRMGRNFIDGRTWTYQTRKEIAAWFPYFSEKQVRAITDNLEKKGVLRKRKFNNKGFDKTIWYAFENEEIFTIAHLGKSSAQTGKCIAQMGKPIPDTKPDTKPDDDDKEAVIVPSSKDEDRFPFKKKELDDLDLPKELDGLELSLDFKRKLMQKYTREEVKKAALRAKRWEGRPNDEAGIQTCLNQAETWSDRKTKKEKQTEDEEYLETLRHLDGKMIGKTNVSMTSDSISFSQGAACSSFRLGEKNFRKGVGQALKNCYAARDKEENQKWFEMERGSWPKETYTISPSEGVIFPFADIRVRFTTPHDEFVQIVQNAKRLTHKKNPKRLE